MIKEVQSSSDCLKKKLKSKIKIMLRKEKSLEWSFYFINTIYLIKNHREKDFPLIYADMMNLYRYTNRYVLFVPYLNFDNFSYITSKINLV